MARNKAEQKAYQEWLDLCEIIKSSTQEIPKESEKQKAKRIKNLTQDFNAFCEYYFGGHYMKSPFGWFHLEAAEAITNDPKIFGILEWPREHAKSVFANVMMPLWLYARGELTGMIVVSANEDKAMTLLSDLQAEFVSNKRWINDYGELARYGDWREGAFSTIDGYGFWAFGRGQSPRGTRKAANRPNYTVIDDIDDKVLVRNDKRVADTVDWILEDLYGALSISGSRLLAIGNRIHKKSVLAHLVGDIEEGDPKHEGRYHLKVFAIEDNRRRKSSIEDGGRPAWKENYTIEELGDKMTKMGFRASRREYFHEHHEEGTVFLNAWIEWYDCPDWTAYDDLVVYCDPSFKDSKKSDYKAVVLLGKLGKYVDVLDCWVRQASTGSMVNTFYDFYEVMEHHSRYYMEAIMLQDLLLDEFIEEGEKRGYQLPIRGDKRSKPDKYSRIENLSPLFERALFRFNAARRKSPDMQNLINQFIGFPFDHDDGPDACEGGIHYLQKRYRASGFKPRTGKYNRSSKRWG